MGVTNYSFQILFSNWNIQTMKYNKYIYIYIFLVNYYIIWRLSFKNRIFVNLNSRLNYRDAKTILISMKNKHLFFHAKIKTKIFFIMKWTT